MMSYQWTINGRNYDQTEPLTVKEGDRARLTFTNMTMMWHPMHLHGHTFQVVKVTAVSALVRTQSSFVDGICRCRSHRDNPGDWMLHCHNGYHQESGMMTRLGYIV